MPGTRQQASVLLIPGLYCAQHAAPISNCHQPAAQPAVTWHDPANHSIGCMPPLTWQFLLTSVSTPSMNKIYTKYEYYLQGGNCIHMRKPDAVAVWGFRSLRTSYVSLNSSATSRGLWGCMQNIFVVNKQRNFFPAQAQLGTSFFSPLIRASTMLNVDWG